MNTLNRRGFLSHLSAAAGAAAVTMPTIALASTGPTPSADAALIAMANEWIALDRAWVIAADTSDGASEEAYQATPKPDVLRWRRGDSNLDWRNTRPVWWDGEAIGRVRDKIQDVEWAWPSYNLPSFRKRALELIAAWERYGDNLLAANAARDVPRLQREEYALHARKKLIFRSIIETRASTTDGLLAKVAVMAQFFEDAEAELAEPLQEDINDSTLALSLARDGTTILAGGLLAA